MINPDHYDVIIIGGGVMGGSTAYSLLLHNPNLNVCVVEADPTYSRASSTLSMANVRVQFSLEANIRISKYALKVLAHFDRDMAAGEKVPHIGYQPVGNLFCVDAEGKKSALADLALQRRLGCDTDWWDPGQIRRAYPLFDPSGVAGATFGRRDGYIDAYAMLMGYKNKAQSLGAVYLHEEAAGVEIASGAVAGVLLASGSRLRAPVAVNCAGAWAARLAATAGIHLPVQPVKRQVFVADPAVKPDKPLPLTLLPSGLYFRTETGGVLLIGKSMESDPVGFDFNWDEHRFMEQLWPELAGFVPAFDTLKLVRGWAGLYAVNTLDGNAILGEWPELKGFFLANGFSGHGLQQAPAVGRYIAELILGLPNALDLSIFGPQRVLENRPLTEGGLI